jgi:protein-disulfide isomerase
MTTRRWVLGSGAVAVSAAAAGIIAFRTSGLAQSLNLPEKLVNDPAVPILGNKMARITVAEFFDYRCPYCRTMQPVLQELLARRNDVRLALREWPIFGGASIYAAKVALAANWQGRFPEVHAALFALPRTMDEAAIRQAAAGAGVDITRLDVDMANRAHDLDTALGDNTVMAHALGFQGTPGFVVGHFKAPGALTLSQLEDMIAQSAPSG